MENFWSVIWVVIWSFVFVAYLFVLFYILTDLFRDHELSGWFKAIWIIGLIFIPYLTALIYIIARGSGMARRQQAAVREARSETDAYIKHVAATGGGSAVSPAQHIADAKALLDNGTINQAEFDKLKQKALA
ncbi:MAG: SHOCT domain-containing protein [Nakamurella sp.]